MIRTSSSVRCTERYRAPRRRQSTPATAASRLRRRAGDSPHNPRLRTSSSRRHRASGLASGTSELFITGDRGPGCASRHRRQHASQRIPHRAGELAQSLEHAECRPPIGHAGQWTDATRHPSSRHRTPDSRSECGRGARSIRVRFLEDSSTSPSAHSRHTGCR